MNLLFLKTKAKGQWATHLQPAPPPKPLAHCHQKHVESLRLLELRPTVPPPPLTSIQPRRYPGKYPAPTLWAGLGRLGPDEAQPLLLPETCVAIHNFCWQNHVCEFASTPCNLTYRPIQAQ